MAGGAVVLGGIVAVPVLLVGGMMISSKAEEAKINAEANYEQAKLYAEEMKLAEVATRGIARRFDEIRRILQKLNPIFIKQFEQMKEIIDKSTDYNSYSAGEKENIFLCVSLAKTMKNIMEAQLLSKEGILTKESRGVVITGKKLLESMN